MKLTDEFYCSRRPRPWAGLNMTVADDGNHDLQSQFRTTVLSVAVVVIDDRGAV